MDYILDTNILLIYLRDKNISQTINDKLLGESSRNIGKNDLWIAATASVLNIPLITTDKDFLHLDKIFLKLEYFDIDLI